MEKLRNCWSLLYYPAHAVSQLRCYELCPGGMKGEGRPMENSRG